MQDMENKRDTQMSEQPEEQTASEAAQTEEETAAAEETAETEQTAEEGAAEEEAAEQTAEEQPQTAENKLNKWLPAAMGYGIFFGALAIAIAIGLLVCLL
jgi:hypothetical protein